MFLSLPDGSEDLGLPFLRGLQGSLQSCSDSDHPPPDGAAESALAARRVRVLQADDVWVFHARLPHLHAGEARRTRAQAQNSSS